MLRNAWKLKAHAEALARASGYADVLDGKQDALRHLVGSALFARRYGGFLAWLASVATELGAWVLRHNTAAQRDMDLHNNKVGRAIARDAGSEEEIVRRAYRAIDDGTARWIVEDAGERLGGRRDA